LDLGLASWLVIAVAIAFANLPFLNEALFGFIPLPLAGARAKPFVVRLAELILLYFAVGLLAYALEARIGNVFPQTWEFYAITGCMFLVLAFPGFIFRYLRKRRA
jgi:ABC-type Na+ efflux pump permease subunit